MVKFHSLSGWTITGEIAEYYTGEDGALMVIILTAGGVFSHFHAERLVAVTA